MPVFMTDVLQAVKKYRTKQAVLFDMDGLIFDSERLFMEQLAVVMQEYGYQLTRLFDSAHAVSLWKGISVS